MGIPAAISGKALSNTRKSSMIFCIKRLFAALSSSAMACSSLPKNVIYPASNMIRMVNLCSPSFVHPDRLFLNMMICVFSIMLVVNCCKTGP
uniref:Uncharacterized protein n=1 Tax=Anguilla anguilla TaxID=7936 RepID=A0A0E9XDQ9_ANGAN